ncbi:MAG: MotA/TolQ/ExbB proton channel family protein [Bacteriovoracales bacterium]|nr:MotA/TolQ/ExbB proton channel family protein [Bacteriovoracales bacterium]
MEFWRIFQEGGWVMYPLLFFSIASWCIIIERWTFLRSFHGLSSRFFDEVGPLLRGGDLKGALEACSRGERTWIADPLKVYLEAGDGIGALDLEAIHERARRRIFDIQLHLKKYLWVLATVSASAPFIGLFGTVVGIIRSFDDIAVAGKGGFSVVAAGISEALIATAAGILVAVIALIFFNYFQVRLSHLTSVYKNRLEDLKDMIASTNKRLG